MSSITLTPRLAKLLKDRKFQPSCSGDKMAPQFKREFDKKRGKAIKKKTGEFDLDEFIQASANSTDLALLKKRYVELGEVPDSGMQPYYGDMTGYPENIHDMYHIMNSADERFKSLPENIRSCFASSDEFLSHVVKGDVYSFIGKKLGAAAPSTPKEGEEAHGE